VNSHLAAFDEQYDKRNSDFQDLSRRLNFDSQILDATELATLPLNLYENDVLFWMVRLSVLVVGDDPSSLSYRAVRAWSRPNTYLKEWY
jgi:phosphatidylinositol-bisphosphatase